MSRDREMTRFTGGPAADARAAFAAVRGAAIATGGTGGSDAVASSRSGVAGAGGTGVGVPDWVPQSHATHPHAAWAALEVETVAGCASGTGSQQQHAFPPGFGGQHEWLALGACSCDAAGVACE